MLETSTWWKRKARHQRHCHPNLGENSTAQSFLSSHASPQSTTHAESALDTETRDESKQSGRVCTRYDNGIISDGSSQETSKNLTCCTCMRAWKCLTLPVHTASLSSLVAPLSTGTSVSPNAAANDWNVLSTLAAPWRGAGVAVGGTGAVDRDLAEEPRPVAAFAVPCDLNFPPFDGLRAAAFALWLPAAVEEVAVVTPLLLLALPAAWAACSTVPGVVVVAPPAACMSSSSRSSSGRGTRMRAARFLATEIKPLRESALDFWLAF